MFADKFISGLATNQYNNLLNAEIIEEIKDLEETQNPPTAIFN